MPLSLNGLEGILMVVKRFLSVVRHAPMGAGTHGRFMGAPKAPFMMP